MQRPKPKPQLHEYAENLPKNIQQIVNTEHPREETMKVLIMCINDIQLRIDELLANKDENKAGMVNDLKKNLVDMKGAPENAYIPRIIATIQDWRSYPGREAMIGTHSSKLHFGKTATQKTLDQMVDDLKTINDIFIQQPTWIMKHFEIDKDRLGF